MIYTRIYIEKKKSGGRPKREFTQLMFEGVRYDAMGKWESSGPLADVHEIDGHIVLVNPLNQKPIAVVHDMNELDAVIFREYKINLT